MTDLRVVRARNGELTALCGARHLHSRFSPSTEAARFVRNRVDARYRTVIVIGPGLGYCFAELRSLLPQSRLIGCGLSPALWELLREQPDALWHPDSPVSLPDFLTSELSDLDSASVLVMEWTPVIECFPEQAAQVRQTVADHLRRGHASLVTQGASGRRWLRNRVFNLATVAPVSAARTGAPIAAAVLVGAGPSAEVALPLLHRVRARVELCVTGSALEVCLRHGLVPDLVFVTDAASYTSEYLRPIAAGPHKTVTVAATLSAARGIAGCRSVLPISENDPLERAFLERSGASAPLVPPHGTVTATAAALLRSSGPMPIVCVGVDFAWHADRSHARPHLSETYRRLAASRVTSDSTWVYGRIVEHRKMGGGWTTDTALDAYAGWFAESGTPRFSPMRAINPSPALRGPAHTTIEELACLPAVTRRIVFRPEHWPIRADRRRILVELLREQRRVMESAPEPVRPDDLERHQSAAGTLAMQLACPELLRWYRTDESQRTGRWQELRSRVVAELLSAEESVR